MPRSARLIAAGHPHHVTHRGLDRKQVFFADEDYRDYLDILRDETRRNDVTVWAYCLMPNHVHLVLEPSTEDGLSRAVGETARRYARASNRRRNHEGHVWHTRYFSVALDERHVLEAARYALLNPVRARLRKSAAAWSWSSYSAHAAESDDIVDTARLAGRIGTIAGFVAVGMARDAADRIRAGTRNGRPLGDERFVQMIAGSLGRSISVRPRGRPPTRPKTTSQTKTPPRNSRDGA